MSDGLINKDQVASLLANGVPAAAVATAVGCDPTYISQLLESQEFRELVAIKGAARLESAVKHDTHIEALEEKSLRAIEQKLPFVRNAAEAAKIFQILNNSKKRAPTNVTQDQQNLQIVNIVLPQASRASIKVNSANQVIEVEGRTMATLPSRALPELSKSEVADAERAETLLLRTNEVSTMMNGVRRVL